MGKRLGAILLAIPLSCAGMVAMPCAEGVSAGTKYPERATLSGPMFLRGDSVFLERERISLEIGELPEEGEKEAGSMASEFVFYNPAAEDAELWLAYPCRQDTGMPRFGLGGEEISTVISMQNYIGYYNQTYDLTNGVRQILRKLGETETPEEDSVRFYRGDLGVKDYQFSVYLPEEALSGIDKKRPMFVATFDCDPTETRVFSCNTMSYEVVNGRLELSFELKQGENRLGFTVAGEDVEHLGYKVYADLAHTMPLSVSVYCAPYSMTFGEYARRFLPEGDFRVSEHDWETGLAEMLASSTVGCVAYGKPCNLRAEAFMNWGIYCITVPAGGRAVNTVTVPLCPVAGENRWQYDILLSPLSDWGPSSFDISLATPYRLAYSNLLFEQNGQTYSFSRDRLPLGELSFSLSEGEPEAGDTVTPAPISPSLKLAFILLGALGGAAVVAGAIAFIVIRRKKRRG